MKLSPNHIFKGTNSDGTTFEVEEWDFATIAGLQAITFFGMLIAGCAFAAIASPILLILSIPVFGTNHGKILNLVAIIVSLLFLNSCSSDGLMVSALNLFCDAPMIKG